MKQYFQLLILMMLLTAQPSLASDEQVAITKSTFNYQVHDGQPYVFAIGFIENNSGYPLEDVTVEVQYYDDNGNLIDSAYENLYSLTIPPTDSVTFKIQTFAAREREFYVSHKARVISSHQALPCSPSAKKNRSQSTFALVKKVFISWFPMILLVLVWIVLARKYSGKGSNQQRLVDLMEKQVKFDEERNKKISDIANSLRNQQNSEK